ncbi:MAG: Fpg/Nei family DNA glycosylase [Acidothermus sp.]|nr:Fpg/Nei family DNA glycosylase [Acidothermus sp.]
MPELPELEALGGFLRSCLVGRRISAVTVASVAALKTYDPPVESLVGRTIGSVVRHGKFLDFVVDDVHLVVHLARGGWIRWEPDGVRRSVRGGPLVMRLAVGDAAVLDITEAGTHKQTACYVVTDPRTIPGIARLGIDPLDPALNPERFAALVQGTRCRLKTWLRDQTILAGIGNAYSDEILHAAKLSPFHPTSSLTPPEINRLYLATRAVLAEAVDHASRLGPDGLKSDKETRAKVHGRAGMPCPVCGDTIRSVYFADSSLQYCPTCQTDGRPLADRRLSRLLK